METSAITENNELFFRICELLMGIGTKVMRRKFEELHHPKPVDEVLKSKKNFLLNKLPKKVLTEKMRNTLFPTPTSYGEITDFDITLLSVLFRSICGLQPPTVDHCGRPSWDENPVKNDYTLPADLVRVKILRNTIYGHAKDTQMSTAEFNASWNDIADVLKRLDPSEKNKNEIDHLYNASLTELEVSYKSDLEVWYSHEQEVIKQLEETKEELQEMKEEMKKLHEEQIEKFTEIAKKLVEKNQEGK